MAKMFIFNGTNSIEIATIREMLGKYKHVIIRDIDEEMWDVSDDRRYEILQNLAKDHEIYLMPNLPDLFDARDRTVATQLESAGVGYGVSTLLQVAAIIGHRPTRWEWLISRYSMGGILGLVQAGATDEEIQLITLRDRLADSGSMLDEATAAQMLQTAKPQRFRDSDIIAYLFLDPIVVGSAVLTGGCFEVERAIVDALLLKHKAGSPLAVFFMSVNDAGLASSIRLHLTGELPFLGVGVKTLMQDKGDYSLDEWWHDPGRKFNYRYFIYNDATSLLAPQTIIDLFCESPFV